MAEVSFSGFGKDDVRLMRVRRDGDKYSVTELKVNVELQLSSTKDYEEGDNRHVVATDSQKNTVLVLAKQNSIQSPEQFGLLLCKHFLSLYSQVVRVHVYIEQAPWQRVRQGGAEHNHAFILEPSVLRFCIVSQLRGGEVNVSGGLKDMKVLKTTQSGFEGFVRDRFTTLPDTKDRTFCTSVFLRYNLDADGGIDIDYNGIWEMARSAALDVFAGPPHTGTFSPSVQKTMCDTAKLIFSKIPWVSSVDIEMPNIHYFLADLSKLNIPMSGELLVPSDSPRGKIAASFTRKVNSKL